MKIASVLLLLPLAAGCTDDHELGVTTHSFGDTEWVKTFPGPPITFAGAVAVDSLDNVIASGLAWGPIDFGSGAVGSDASSMYVTKRDHLDGAEVWSDMISYVTNASYPDGPVGGVAPALAVDANDDIYVAGQCVTPAGIAVLGATLSCNVGGSLFVVKLAPTGAVLWAEQITGTPSSQSGPQFSDPQIAVGSDGGLVVATNFYGSITAPDGTVLADAQSSDTDVLIEALDASGSAEWARAFQGTGNQAVTGLGVAPNGDVVAGGYIEGSATFGGPALAPAAGNNQWVARLTSTGALVWQQIIGSPQLPVMPGPLAIAPSGDIIVGYNAFAPDGQTMLPAIAELTSDGSSTWETQALPASPGGGTEVAAAVRDDGTVLSLGRIQNDAIDLGNGPVGGTAYLAAYDPTGESGSLPATRGYCGGGALCGLWGLASTHTGSVVFVGELTAATVFGDTAVAVSGEDEAVIVKLAAPPAP